MELDVDDGRPAGRHRFGEIHARHRSVRGGSAVGMHERPRERLSRLGHRAELQEAPLALLRSDPGAVCAIAGHLDVEGAAFPLESVQVEVEVERSDRHRAAVAPGQALLPFHRMLARIEDGLEAIVGDGIGERRLAAGAHATPRLGSGGNADRAGVRSGDGDSIRRGFRGGRRSRRLPRTRRGGGRRRRGGLRGLRRGLRGREDGAEEGREHHRGIVLGGVAGV